MAAKLSDLGNRMSGTSLQMEGSADMPSQSAKDPWELGASGSSPTHHLGPQSGGCCQATLISDIALKYK